MSRCKLFHMLPLKSHPLTSLSLVIQMHTRKSHDGVIEILLVNSRGLCSFPTDSSDLTSGCLVSLSKQQQRVCGKAPPPATLSSRTNALIPISYTIVPTYTLRTYTYIYILIKSALWLNYYMHSLNISYFNTSCTCYIDRVVSQLQSSSLKNKSQ